MAKRPRPLRLYEEVMLLALRNDKGTIAGGVMYQQAAGGALPVGSVASALPAGCTASTVGGVEYQHCGNDWYRSAFQGDKLVYVTTAPPQ